jgi:hypothetical protein
MKILWQASRSLIAVMREALAAAANLRASGVAHPIVPAIAPAIALMIVKTIVQTIAHKRVVLVIQVAETRAARRRQDAPRDNHKGIQGEIPVDRLGQLHHLR